MLIKTAKALGVPEAALPVAVRYIFRLAKMRDIPGLDRERHHDFKTLLTASRYTLVNLRRAVVLACKFGRPIMWAAKFGVLREDMRLAMRSLSTDQRASLAAPPYWPRSEAVNARVLEILAPQIRTRVRKKLTFIGLSDPSVSLEDLYWRVIGEGSRLLCVYDRLVPTRRVDVLYTRKNRVALQAQPINKVESVKVEIDGRSIPVPRTCWSLANDVLTVDDDWWNCRINIGERVAVTVDYWHSLEMLNFVSKGVRHEVGRLISYYTAKRRHRSVRTRVADSDGDARYDYTTASLSAPTTPGSDGKTRAYEEVIADPLGAYHDVDSRLSIEFITRAIAEHGDPRLVQFTKICLGEPDAEFTLWCKRKRIAAAETEARTASEFRALRKAALEFCGLRETDLLVLKSVVHDGAA